MKQNVVALKSPSADSKHLEAIDKQHVWHPFTQTTVWQEDSPLIVARGEGCYLFDIDGKRYLDGTASLWCNVHGHSVPELTDAIKAQADAVCHSTILGLSHQPLLELTERLMRIVPDGLTRVFYADSGSTAVEAALRMALEYWQKEGSDAGRKKTRLASLVGGYHGDTLGAVSVGYLDAFHGALAPALVQARRVQPPHYYRFYQGMTAEDALSKSIAELEQFFKEHAAELAAFIVEPLVQGASGIWVHPEAYLQSIARLCKAHNVLFLADEVATGFGKTGAMFACELAAVQPDILIIGKGLSAGYLPISAAIATEKVFDVFSGSTEELKTFFYGQTFAGNALAARAAEVNLAILERDKVVDAVNGKAEHLGRALEQQIAVLPQVDEVRRLGLMCGIELTQTPGKHDPYPANELAGVRIVRAAREMGAIIRPLGNVMVLMPALAMSEEQLSTLVSVTAEAITEALGS